MSESVSMEELEAQIAHIFVSSGEGIDQLRKLVGLVDSDDKRAIVSKAIGDLARMDENRDLLSPVAEQMVTFLAGAVKSGHTDLQQWASRSLGNLCYEHSKNITAIDEAGAIPLLVPLLGSPDDLVKRSCTGALLNLASESDDIQCRIGKAGALHMLIENTCTSSNEMVQTMGARALVNLSDNATNLEEMIVLKVPQRLLALLAFPISNDIKIEVLDSCVALGENSDAASVALMVDDGLILLLGAIGKTDGEVTTVVPDDLPLASRLLDVLFGLSRKERFRHHFLEGGALELLLRYSSPSFSSAFVRVRALRVLCQLAMHDGCMRALFPRLDDILVHLTSDDPENQLNSAWIVGNLAREDTQCLAMADSKVVLPLLRQMECVEGPKLQHVAISALRNISIPDVNKSKLAEEGVIEHVVKYGLTATAPQVKFSAIGALRSLVLDAENGQKVIDNGGVELLCNTVNDHNTAKGEGEEEVDDFRVQYEAARIIVTLLGFDVEPITATVAASDSASLLAFLFRTDFEVLNFEGAQGMERLVNAGATPAIASSGLLEAALAVLKSSTSGRVHDRLLCALASMAETHGPLLAKWRDRIDSAVAGASPGSAQGRAARERFHKKGE